MKDSRTGKKVLFVPRLAYSGGIDDVDPAFITDVTFNRGARDIAVTAASLVNRGVAQTG